jgi:hypothetical protein
MIKPDKTPSFPIIGNLMTALLGVFLAAFVFSFVMDGLWAFIFAMLGGMATSFFIRFMRIRMQTMLPGLLIGYFACIAILIWNYWGYSVNPWVSAAYVFTMGIVRTFISDDLFVRSLNRIFRFDV